MLDPNNLHQCSNEELRTSLESTSTDDEMWYYIESELFQRWWRKLEEAALLDMQDTPCFDIEESAIVDDTSYTILIIKGGHA